MIRRRRDEQGVIAIIAALVVTLMFVMAALTVDLGNAYMQKRERQKDTDLATLAGAGIAGANLPATSGATCGTATYVGPKAAATDQAVKDVAGNLAQQWGGSFSATTLATQLTDCSATNGEVVYGRPVRSGSLFTATLNKNQLSVISPPRHVDYGFARILGVNGVDVNGVATVEIRSPSLSTLPFYAFSGCDYGPQTLQQPNNGNAAGTVMLYAPNDTNNATLTAVTPSFYPAGTASGTPQPIDITGTNLANVTDVGSSSRAMRSPAPYR